MKKSIIKASGCVTFLLGFSICMLIGISTSSFIVFIITCIVTLSLLYNGTYLKSNIEGYSMDDSTLSVINKGSNCDIYIPILYTKPKCITDDIYYELQRTLVEYKIPTEELILSLDNSINGASIQDAILIRHVSDALKQRVSRSKLIDYSIASPIQLKDNEILHFASDMSCLERYETHSTDYTSYGTSVSMGIARVNTRRVYSHTNERMTKVSAFGNTFITNKRIVYIDGSTQKTYVIPLGRIINWYITNDSIVIVVSDGKPYKFTMLFNFVYSCKSCAFYDHAFLMDRTLDLLLNSK